MDNVICVVIHMDLIIYIHRSATPIDW